MSADIERLIEELRYGDAARLAEAEGDLERAAWLFAMAGDLDALRPLLASLGAASSGRVAAECTRRAMHRAAAMAWEGAGDLERAERACSLSRDAIGAARLASLQGDDLRAAAHLEARLVTAPDDDDARLALAKLSMERGRQREAGAIAACVRRGGSRGEADALIERAIGVQPTDPESGALQDRFTDVTAVANSPHARVMSARDRASGERVALKVLRLGTERGPLVRALASEARALAALRHPSVVPLVAFDGDAGLLVTRWMEGGSLKAALGGGPLSAARVAEVGRAIASALAAAHAVSVVHRDVTPGNILFDGAGSAHLADFGVAHVVDAAATVTAGLVGTLGYLAPEVRRGARATPASDVYSLGRVLNEALSGALDDARPPSALRTGLDAGHDRLIAAMTDDDAAKRPSAAAVAAWIDRLRWPAATADQPARADVDASTPSDALARTEARVPVSPEALEVARIVSRGAAEGLSALPTVRRATASEIVVERLPPAAPRPLAADEQDEVRAATDYLRRHGVASSTFVCGQRGPVVVPIALMPR